MGGFNRKISINRITAMKANYLWENWLKKGITSGEIFPAIRDEEIHFYYKGGCLFKYSDCSYKFNREYLKYNDLWKSIGYNSLEEVNGLEGYVSLSSIFPIKKSESEIVEYKDNFQDAVERKFTNKKNCKKERQFLEPLYVTYSDVFNKNVDNNIVVLDIEVRNNEIDKSKCDLVLFNKEKGMIMFVEAKLASDSRVRSRTEKFEVKEQINKYNIGIDNCKIKYCEQYENYMKTMKDILCENYFGENINKINICNTSKLIIFEDKENRNFQNYFKGLKKQLGKDVAYFSYEESKNITPEKLWNVFDD